MRDTCVWAPIYTEVTRFLLVYSLITSDFLSKISHSFDCFLEVPSMMVLDLNIVKGDQYSQERAVERLANPNCVSECSKCRSVRLLAIHGMLCHEGQHDCVRSLINLQENAVELEHSQRRSHHDTSSLCQSSNLTIQSTPHVHGICLQGPTATGSQPGLGSFDPA